MRRLGIALCVFAIFFPTKVEGQKAVGCILPLSGMLSSWGRSELEGIELAFSLAGSSAPRLVVEDERYDPTVADKAVVKLVGSGEIAVFLGPVTSADCLAISPFAQAARIPLLSPSVDPLPARAGNFVFSLAPPPGAAGAAAARIARGKLGAGKAACLFASAGDRSRLVAEAFRSEFEALGGTVSAWEVYSPGDAGSRQRLAAIMATKPELLFLPANLSDSLSAAKTLRSLGWTGVVIGGESWDAYEPLRQAGFLEGCYFTTAYSRSDPRAVARAFATAFQLKYGHAPDHAAAAGYDAALILLDAVARTGGGGGKTESLRDALRATDIEGACARISFDDNRLARKAVSFLRVSSGTAVWVDALMP